MNYRVFLFYCQKTDGVSAGLLLKKIIPHGECQKNEQYGGVGGDVSNVLKKRLNLLLLYGS